MDGTLPEQSFWVYAQMSEQAHIFNRGEALKLVEQAEQHFIIAYRSMIPSTKMAGPYTSPGCVNEKEISLSSEGSLLLFRMQTAIYTNDNRSRNIDELLKILQKNCLTNHNNVNFLWLRGTNYAIM